MPRKAEGGGARSSGGNAPPQATAWALALLRVFLGVKFLQYGISKWSWLGTSRLSGQLMAWTAGTHPAALASYVGFLRQFILPQATLFTYLVVFGEILVGVFLLFGILSRVTVLPALLMNVNYLLATWNLGPAAQGVNEAFLMIELAILITGAGRYFGLDSQFAKKYPQWPLW